MLRCRGACTVGGLWNGPGRKQLPEPARLQVRMLKPLRRGGGSGRLLRCLHVLLSLATPWQPTAVSVVQALIIEVRSCCQPWDGCRVPHRRRP